MVEWSQPLLGELLSLKKGRKVETHKRFYLKSATTYLGASELEGGTANQFTSDSTAIKCNPQDVLMLWDGERSGLVGIGLECAVGSTLARLRVDSSNIDARYLYHYLRREFDTIQALRKGTGVPHVPKDLVNLMRVSVPLLSEQRQIAETLDSIDKTVSATRAVVLKCMRMRSGIRQSLVCEAQREDDDIVRIRDVGIIIGGSTPSREVESYWNGSIPWLTPTEITNLRSKYIYSTIDCISARGFSESGLRIVPKDSLVITTRASIGYCALAGTEMTTNQGFKSLIPNDRVDPSYLLHLGRTLGPEMTRRASGTTFLEISGKEFGRIEVRVPPMTQQRRIAEILDCVDEVIAAHERELEKLKMLRDGVADDLLTGRVRTVAP